MDLIYELGIRLYSLAIVLAAPFSEKARLLRRGRKEAFRYLAGQPEDDRPLVWVHCASLGEFEQGRPLIEAIRREQPDFRILLTFFSPSGCEVRKDYALADYICYLPADTRRNVRRFLELTCPQMAFFIKYEFWKNYFEALNRRQIPLYLVSAIFRENQLFFKKGWRGRWYARMLDRVSHFFVQDAGSARLLEPLQPGKHTVTGDTRFDRVAEIAAAGKELPVVERFRAGSRMIVAGSTWPPDEELLAAYLEQNPSVKMILAPHEVKEANIRRLLEMLPEKAVRYTRAGADVAVYRILVVDCIGILSAVYRYASVAYIGGGFGAGIHNTLEAAIYSIPVLFGPNYRKFREAVNLEERQAAWPVHTAAELGERLDSLLGDEGEREAIARRCQAFMAENLGATGRIMKRVFPS
ncbi:MAG: 3-deoxy-D-manno-octulosonic acid transferase [Mangrovibacterium sp.]